MDGMPTRSHGQLPRLRLAKAEKHDSYEPEFLPHPKKLQNMIAGMKPKDKTYSPESNELIEVKEREDHCGDKQTHSKGQTHPAQCKQPPAHAARRNGRARAPHLVSRSKARLSYAGRETIRLTARTATDNKPELPQIAGRG